MTDSDCYIGVDVVPEVKSQWMKATEESPKYRSWIHLICVTVEAELGKLPDSTGEVDLWRDWKDDLLVQTPIKVYGDSEYEHRRDSIKWIGFGPVDLGVPGQAERERVDEVNEM